MSRRPKNSQTVALFPFLAVLVCTMGSLIFLLLVTTRMIRDRVVPSVAAAPPAAAPAIPDLIPSPPEREFEPDPASAPLPVLIEPGPALPSPAELAAARRNQHQRELDGLIATWQQRLESLNEIREERVQQLSQRQQLQKVASQRVESLQKELAEAEVRLGKLTGELSAYAVDKGSARELIELEALIRELKRRLRAAQQVESAEHQFEVVPFDPVSGTSRRPILIECTANGLRFVPEDVIVRPVDLTGFSPRVNPLLVGSSALVNYWTAWNMRQENPAREPEPYVLLVVRPSGTVAYYVAMKMLSELRQPHGYELIDEETVLNLPPVDPGAKAACETAVNRLIAERNSVLRQAGMLPNTAPRRGAGSGPGGGSGGTFPGGGPGAGSAAGSVGPGSGPGAGSASGGQFQLSDVMNTDPAAGQSWDRIENFEGARRGGPGDVPPRSAENSRAAVGDGRRGNPAVTAGGQSVDELSGRPEAAPGRPGTVPGTPGTVAGATGAGSAETPDESRAALENPDAGPGIGLGSSGNRTIPVEDRRSRKTDARHGPMKPEDLVHRPWGIAEPGATIGLEREVRVDVHADKYVISRKQAIRIQPADTPEDSFAQIVGALDQQARDWGKPPQGFYWKPSLRYVIQEGGDPAHERVRSLIDRAGLSSTRESASEANAQEPVPAVPTPAPAVPPAPAPAAPKPTRGLFRGIFR